MKKILFIIIITLAIANPYFAQKMEIINNDTINFTDSKGLKQGLWVEETKMSSGLLGKYENGKKVENWNQYNTRTLELEESKYYERNFGQKSETHKIRAKFGYDEDAISIPGVLSMKLSFSSGVTKADRKNGNILHIESFQFEDSVDISVYHSNSQNDLHFIPDSTISTKEKYEYIIRLPFNKKYKLVFNQKGKIPREMIINTFVPSGINSIYDVTSSVKLNSKVSEENSAEILSLPFKIFQFDSISKRIKKNPFYSFYLKFKESQMNDVEKYARVRDLENKANEEILRLNKINEEKAKAIELKDAESKQQKQILVFVALGLFAVVIFSVFVARSLRQRNKQNKVITEQKNLLEAKQKEILDSIEYALRIQTAILPPQKIVKQYLENSFILYKPKDIVAGDFYWMETINDLVLFAACDCTGHGVPGAMVSVVCHNALNRAVREFGLTQPAAILDKTAEIVIENFSKSEEDIKDGMDISLCAYNAKTKTIQWAGANNPLWLLQRGELIETKADKQPIGMNENSKPFTNHTFNLNATDTIYLFTDGFADQFGGETGQKKLTKKRFKDLILSVQNKSLQEQGIALEKFIIEYRKEVEQIDDILVMGVQV